MSRAISPSSGKPYGVGTGVPDVGHRPVHALPPPPAAPAGAAAAAGPRRTNAGRSAA